jgi:hypothetical protein
VVKAKGKVNFGGGFFGFGAPVLDANGDGDPAPDDYPAPRLKKNSLICELGGDKSQCGMERKLYPDERAELILYPNDLHAEDNGGAWTVHIEVIRPDSHDVPPETGVTRKYQAFPVQDHIVETDIQVEGGSTVITEAPGKIDFGCLASGCIYDADGNPNNVAGQGHPFPRGTELSLVFAVGGEWYQGGVSESQAVNETGELRITPNDSFTAMGDNSRGWTVSITVVPPGATDQFDPAGQWARVGHFEKTVTRLTGTDIVVQAGTAIKVDASGEIDVCCAPFQSRFQLPDGEHDWAPDDFPAPGLRKYSLIVQVGQQFYQAGANAWVVPLNTGRVQLMVNDPVWDDNVGGRESRDGWTVSLTTYEPETGK